jgi:hypothetical protein
LKFISDTKWLSLITKTYLKGLDADTDQRDALANESVTLTHVRRFGEKAAHEQAAKVAKTHGGSASFKLPAPKPLTIGSP